MEEKGPRLGPSSTKLERSRPSEDEDEELSEFLFGPEQRNECE